MADRSARAAKALEVLTLLNEARRIGQLEAAALLDEQLEVIDSAGGYLRRLRPADQRVFQRGERARNPNRNSKGTRE